MSLPRLNKEDIRRNTICIRAEGTSMLPLLRNQDLVEFKKTSFSQVDFNDIILVYSKELFVTHRVIYKGKDYVITRGDNNKNADERVEQGRILAKAVRYKRNKKWYGIQDIYVSQSIIYSHEILSISRELKKKNIRHVYIKGLVTSLKYVKEFPQRIYGDIDVLIDRNDYQKVKDVFLLNKYKEINDQWLSFKKEKEVFFEVDFFKIIKSLIVVFDVHVEPVFLMIKMKGMDYLYTDKDRRSLGNHFIKNSAILSFMGSQIPVCSVADQIIYLSLHLFHNNFTDIVRLCLIKEIIQKNKFPGLWKVIESIATKYKLQGYIYPVFSLLEKYYDIRIPKSVDARFTLKGYKGLIAAYLIHSTPIFNLDSRLIGGIKRLFYSFIFSPEPMRRKVLIFFHPGTLMSFIWVIVKVISLFVKRGKIERN